ncbi:MAG TPA: Calx-beta domain-containing protein [Pyrinomonadaceae bacterium]|nr:Calx-beta domain-containing protein [Pyrinomonadaceae bacterium]
MERLSANLMKNYNSNWTSFLAVIFWVLISSSVSSSQSIANSDIRISQIYSRGGEAGATFQNDYIELFNRGQANVDISGWSLSIANFSGTPPNIQISSSSIKLFGSAGIILAPGSHFLIKFGGNGGNGQPIPNSDINLNPVPISDTGAQIVLLDKDKTLPFGYCPAAPDLTGNVVDFVGYGIAICYEGTVTLAPPPDRALLRVGGGCTDNNDNLADFSFATPDPRSRQAPLSPCGAPSTSVIDFGAPQFDVSEDQRVAQITVTRIGDVSSRATVDYFTSDNSASERTDYTTTLGTLRFDAGETQKTLNVLITDDLIPEANETVFLGLLRATGNASIGPRNSAALVIHDNDFSTPSNVVDISSWYVPQHYNDFLSRTSDPNGEAFWINNIESCGASAECREVKRIDTSAAFFLSIEFQRTGFLVYRVYKASLPETVQRPRAMPRYLEFIRDMQGISQGVIVGNPGWQEALEANTVRFTTDFVYRPEFLATYPPTLSAAAYVDKLNTQAGNVLTFDEFFQLANGLMAGLETRGSVLRKIAEHEKFISAEYNRAFVLMQYFGYLRRNPDDAPDLNFSGFDFWLNKLDQFGGDYRAAEMVRAFINSGEFRHRFDP